MNAIKLIVYGENLEQHTCTRYFMVVSELPGSFDACADSVHQALFPSKKGSLGSRLPEEQLLPLTVLTTNNLGWCYIGKKGIEKMGEECGEGERATREGEGEKQIIRQQTDILKSLLISLLYSM